MYRLIWKIHFAGFIIDICAFFFISAFFKTILFIVVMDFISGILQRSKIQIIKGHWCSDPHFSGTLLWFIWTCIQTRMQSIFTENLTCFFFQNTQKWSWYCEKKDLRLSQLVYEYRMRFFDIKCKKRTKDWIIQILFNLMYLCRNPLISMTGKQKSKENLINVL